MNLPAIKKLCEAATGGPWENVRGIEGGIVCDIDGEAWDITDDAEFIAQARTLVPQLVTALEEARELAMEMGASSSVQVQDFRDRLLAILGESG